MRAKNASKHPSWGRLQGYYHLNGTSAIVKAVFVLPQALRLKWRGMRRGGALDDKARNMISFSSRTGRNPSHLEGCQGDQWRADDICREKKSIHCTSSTIACLHQSSEQPSLREKEREQKAFQFHVHDQDSCERPNCKFHINSKTMSHYIGGPFHYVLQNIY